MSSQVIFTDEAVPAVHAAVRPRVRVRLAMRRHVRALVECQSTKVAHVRPLASVGRHVPAQAVRHPEGAGAHDAYVGFVSGVSQQVGFQRGFPREPVVARIACIRPGVRVAGAVSSELGLM